jgi:hypothetical protein
MKRMIMALVMSGLLAAMLSGVAAAGGKTVDYGWGDGPNQGEESKVVLVPGPAFCTCVPVPSMKYEGSFGKIESIDPDGSLYGVSVKSGKNAEFKLVYVGCGKYEIRGTKDISNFVIWTCPSPCVAG